MVKSLLKSLFVGLALLTSTSALAEEETTTEAPYTEVTHISGLADVPYGTDVLLHMTSYPQISFNASGANGQFLVIKESGKYVLLNSDLALALSDMMESQDVNYAYKSITLAAKWNENANGMPELQIADSTGTKSSFTPNKQFGSTTPTPVALTSYQIQPDNADANLAKYGKLEDTANRHNITLSGSFANGDVVAELDGVKLKIMDPFVVLSEDYVLPEAATSITGLFVKDGGEYALYIFGEEPIVAAPVNHDVANIGELSALADGDLVTLSVNDAIVKCNWNNGGYVLISDGTGTIRLTESMCSNFYEYGNKNFYHSAIKAGDILNGTLKAIYTVDEYGSKALDQTGVDITTSSITATTGTSIVATETTIAEAMKAENFGDLVTIKNVTLSGKYAYQQETITATDGVSTIKIVDALNELVSNPGTDTYDVPEKASSITGLIIDRGSDIVLFPYGKKAIVADESTGINSINAETSAAKTIYNINGQRVSKAAKGLFIVNGKKEVKR